MIQTKAKENAKHLDNNAVFKKMIKHNPHLPSSTGKLSTMKRGQDDISQAKKETECGLSFEKFTDVEEGDVVQCYSVIVKKQAIDWNWGF